MRHQAIEMMAMADGEAVGLDLANVQPHRFGGAVEVFLSFRVFVCVQRYIEYVKDSGGWMRGSSALVLGRGVVEQAIRAVFHSCGPSLWAVVGVARR